MDQEFVVRIYVACDRDDVLRISADTAVFGKPVEAILDDRRVFCDSFTADYTDFEPEYLWVACANRRVVGYLTGCVDTASQQKLLIRRTILPLVGNALRGKYRLGGKTFKFAWNMLVGVVRGENLHVDLEQYPAHLHINLEASTRGRGLGRRLMWAYLEQLRVLGVPGVFLHTTDHNQAACRLYESLGFVLLEQCNTSAWRDVIAGPIENRSYGLRLQSQAQSSPD